MSQGAAGAGAEAWASAAATYAANHATTGEEPIKRDRPIIQNAMRHIINLIQNLPGGGEVSEPIIWNAIVETFENTMTFGKEGLDVDAVDLSRLVIERTNREIIKTFRNPNLTDREVTEIIDECAKLGGGRRKKRRTGKKAKGKKAKGKTRKNSRTIKKKWNKKH